MPLYEYFCSECQSTFELLRSMEAADRGVRCRSCDSPHVSRTISLTAPVGVDSPDLHSGACACGGGMFL